ncbi:MAG: helix-turn-helix domain-containing protein [Clostridia bacterium]|nr:helix-turn-helix domain-containing protein [Clostridia bacterium]
MKKTVFNNNRNVIFNQLKAARLKAGLTQKQLAAKMQVANINIDQQMISKIEHNRRFVTDYELACICGILDVTEKELLADYYVSLT